MDELNLSALGRGQTFMFSPSLQKGGFRGRPLTSTPQQAKVNGAEGGDVSSSADQLAGPSAFSGGRDVDHVPVHVLTDLVKQIGTSIGENIASCLRSAPTGDVTLAPSTIADLSKMSLTVSQHSGEPHPFRGDKTDKLSVSEWEDCVKVYLTKRDVQLCDQAEEVMGRLQGRARDVVRVGVRSKPSLVLRLGPQPIFDILKQHFSESVTSFMPLADFYDTKPLENESAVDYWIRLNKALDTATDGLKRQGKTIDDSSREVTVMFITHCPDRELSLVFSCRPLEEWTAMDVQVRLDEHHHKKRLQQRHSAARPTDHLQYSQAVDAVHSHVQTAVTPAAQPAMTGGPVSGESHVLGHIVTLLERLLQRESPQRYGQPRQRPVGRTRARGPCAICGCDDHDTASHCRNERLCFRCHAAGHQAATCSAPPAPGSPTQQGN